MTVILNGKETEIREGQTLVQLLQEHELSPETVVVELNREIIASDAFENVVLNDGDHLEVLRFVGGG